MCVRVRVRVQTGNKLRLKDLVDVKWTAAAEDLGKGKAMCPTCKKVFSNISRIVVLKVSPPGSP
eukprot:9503954-Pyramimonas_sp.AAC.2